MANFAVTVTWSIQGAHDLRDANAEDALPFSLGSLTPTVDHDPQPIPGSRRRGMPDGHGEAVDVYSYRMVYDSQAVVDGVVASVVRDLTGAIRSNLGAFYSIDVTIDGGRPAN